MSGNQSSSMPFIQSLSNLCQNLVDIGISTCDLLPDVYKHLKKLKLVQK